MRKIQVAASLSESFPAVFRGDITAGIKARIILRGVTQTVGKHEEIENLLGTVGPVRYCCGI